VRRGRRRPGTGRPCRVRGAGDGSPVLGGGAPVGRRPGRAQWPAGARAVARARWQAAAEESTR
jgi:hypothetical protein